MKINELEQKLREASDAYYNAEPVMSDADFDALCEELRKLDPTNTFLKEIGAQIQTSVWPKVKHRYTMGSQEKVKEKGEFLKWATRAASFVLTDKLDGSTIALTYKNGQLMSAVTRGDGTEGEEITPNVMRMANVKECLEGFSGVIRGEMVISLSDFDTNFKPLGYKNPRNAANGVARDKSNSPLMAHIKVMPFDVIGTKAKTELDKAELLKKLGLEYVYIKGPFTAEQVWSAFEQRAIDRPTLDFEVDGTVIKVNNVDIQESLGSLNGRPKGQVAIKYSAQSKETTLLDIDWQVGKNGRITPVALLEPVDIGGVTISRCTLNNRDYLAKLNISVGAKVIVTRNNDVIPGVSGVAKPGTGKTNEPTKCPTCGETLEREGAYIFCAMIDCQGKVVGSLNAWLRATKIRGIGPAVLRGLIDLDVTDAGKLVSVSRETLTQAANSDKIADKIKQQLDDSLNMDLATLLYGLNVPHLGEINSRRVAKHFGSIDKIRKATVDEIAEVPGVKTTAVEIAEALAERGALLDVLTKHVNVQAASGGTGPLSGMSFCITGELSKPREVVQEWIRQHGGEVKAGVSKDLNYLVMADPNSASSKAEKARKYGTKCIGEEDLSKMV